MIIDYVRDRFSVAMIINNERFNQISKERNKDGKTKKG
jgi:hypothetical protein